MGEVKGCENASSAEGEAGVEKPAEDLMGGEARNAKS